MRFISLALLVLFAISDTAAAQLAPQRTWPELKEAVQERANRNAYPIGLPPEKWSSLMYGLWPDGGLKNGKEATHCGRDRHEAAAG